MLRDTFAVATEAAAQLIHCDVVIAHTPDTAPHFTTVLPECAPSTPHYPQGDGDLAARLIRCLNDMRARGYERVMIIGSDAPDIPTEYLHAAFGQLQDNALVFGSTCDGGFYLIGSANELPAALLENIEWSTPRVLESALANAKRLELIPALLSPWQDVDDARDLQALIARLKNGQSTAPHTWRVLASLRLVES